MTRNPIDDYFCHYCAHNLYCASCEAAVSREENHDQASTVYGNYYSEYYAKQYGYHHVYNYVRTYRKGKRKIRISKRSEGSLVFR